MFESARKLKSRNPEECMCMREGYGRKTNKMTVTDIIEFKPRQDIIRKKENETLQRGDMFQALTDNSGVEVYTPQIKITKLRINVRKTVQVFLFFSFLNYAVMGGVLTLLLRGRGQRRQPRWDSQQMEANGFRRRLNVTCAWGNSNAIAIALHTYMHVL